MEEVTALSSQGGKYKETTRLFPENPFHRPFSTHLSSGVVLLLDPMNQSHLIDLSYKKKPARYSFRQVRLLMALLGNSSDCLDALRIEAQYSTSEWEKEIHWGTQQLQAYDLPTIPCKPIPPDDALSAHNTHTLAPFENEEYSLRHILRQIRDVLLRSEYTEIHICTLLGLDALQQIDPTHLHYYNRFVLPDTDLADLIRVFLLRVALPRPKLETLFGQACFQTLRHLGVLIPRGEAFASRIDLYDVDGFFIGTDHRYMLLDEDRIAEDPVMYVGLDSLGLVNTAPRDPANHLLDLCTGSGVQAIVASRYAKEVIGVDVNPRAIRFSRFNAQLNGIENVTFLKGNLYDAVHGRSFDGILANPPFVPSPVYDLGFRDGGRQGEEILAQIISNASQHLRPLGKLHIVSDLVDLNNYESKLSHWWKGGPAQTLILHTADRNEVLFSVPHSHAPFGQDFKSYNQEIERWINNFRRARLTAVNFGYILIHRLLDTTAGSYKTRVISSPLKPIHEQVKQYFEQQALLRRPDCSQLFLSLNQQMVFCTKFQYGITCHQVELCAPDNPYFTTYVLTDSLLELVKEIARHQPRLGLFLAGDHCECILDLINKGILLLGPRPHPHMIQEDWNGHGQHSLTAWAPRGTICLPCSLFKS